MDFDKDELLYTEVHNRFSNIKPLDSNKTNEETPDNAIISAVFVVSFDHKKEYPRKDRQILRCNIYKWMKELLCPTILTSQKQDSLFTGNILEWCMPGDVNYTGIEFKALVSGSHHVKSDFVYFRQYQFYGVGCFALRPLKEEDGERGVRMKTVGILSNSYSNLHQHIEFLDSTVRHILVHHGDYDRLIAFYSDQTIKTKNVIPISIDLDNTAYNVFDYERFLTTFGIKIFTLWKLVLLRKRIMVLSNPPIGPICQQVICCHRLGSHDIDQLQYLQPQLMFNISLSDTEQFKPSFWQQAFVACSTDQIIQIKKTWYDCLIRESNIEMMNEADSLISEAVSVSSSDKVKFAKLLDIRQNIDCSKNNWEECVISFFKSENNRLLSVLLDLANSGEPEITTSQIEHLGFHPREDKDFLLLLLETYGIDLVYHIDSKCC